MDDFIKQNLRYPQEAMDNKVEGTVSVEFDIDIFGDVVETRIKHGLGYGCDEEALRVVRTMPQWKPGKQNGRAVNVNYNLPINFTLK